MTTITKEKLEMIGLKAWQHPTKTDDIRYYFNMRYFSSQDCIIVSRAKDSALCGCKIYFDKDMELQIYVPKDITTHLNIRNIKGDIERFIINKISDKEENKQMINEVKEQIRKQDEEQEQSITSTDITDDELAQLISEN